MHQTSDSSTRAFTVTDMSVASRIATLDHINSHHAMAMYDYLRFRQAIELGKRVDFSRLYLSNFSVANFDLSKMTFGSIIIDFGTSNVEGTRVRGASVWSVLLRRSNRGYEIVSVKKNGKRSEILPSHVRSYLGTDDPRRLISDRRTVDYLRKIFRGKRLATFSFAVSDPPPKPKNYGKPPRLEYPSYLGDGSDGVAYGSAYTSRGKWWAIAWAEGNSDWTIDEPGYKTEKDARIAAKDAAFDWCMVNDIDCSKDDDDDK